MAESHAEGFACRLDDPAAVAAMHLAAADATHHVLGAFADAGIAAIPVKGILTARMLYASIEQRPIRDVDLRILPADLPRALDVVRRQGWELVSRMRVYGSAGFRARGFPFDLETHVGAPFMSGLTVAEMLSRATVRQDPLGFPHRHPELHDHALLLCLNVYKDHLVHAADWAVRDVERIVGHPRFNPAELARRARAAGNATMLYVLSTWLVQHRRVELWQGVLSELRLPPRPVYARAMSSLLQRRSKARSTMMRLLARQASDRPWDRVASVATMAGFGMLHGP